MISLSSSILKYNKIKTLSIKSIVSYSFSSFSTSSSLSSSISSTSSSIVSNSNYTSTVSTSVSTLPCPSLNYTPDILYNYYQEGLKNYSFSKILSEYLLLSFIKNPLAINIVKKFLKSSSSNSSSLTSILLSPLSSLIYSFLYLRFCGGKTKEISLKTCHTSLSQGIISIIDKSNEDAKDLNEINQNLNDKINLIRESKNICIAIPIKLTSIFPYELLEKITKIILEEDKKVNEIHQDPLELKDYIKNSLIILSKLNQNDQILYEKSYQNLIILCNEAKNNNINIWLDAEQMTRQPAVEFLYRSLALKYNKINNNNINELPLLYNTYQCYLKRTNQSIYNDLLFSIDNNLHFGVKIVRGAYLSNERNMNSNSSSSFTTSVIQDSKEDTDINYNNILSCIFPFVNKNIENYQFDKLLKRNPTLFSTSNSSLSPFSSSLSSSTSNSISSILNNPNLFNKNFLSLLSTTSYSSLSVLICTHNHSSILHALDLIKKNQINNRSYSVQFCQINGLSSSISSFLLSNNCLSSKLFLYGEENHLSPWFVRRLEEHQDNLGAMNIEKELFKKELIRRLNF